MQTSTTQAQARPPTLAETLVARGWRPVYCRARFPMASTASMMFGPFEESARNSGLFYPTVAFLIPLDCYEALENDDENPFWRFVGNQARTVHGIRAREWLRPMYADIALR